jgi:hypothetical protein
MTDSSGVPITNSDDSAGLGLGISMGSYSSPSFSDEVDAEMARRHGAIPPPRSDSLPGVAKPPNTMNELNELNEQDPAFTRAVEGLRMATEDKEEGEEDGDDEGETVETDGSSKKDKKKGKGKKKKKGRKHWF